MRVITEYNDKRVDIKIPVSRHDSKPDTPEVMAALINEVLSVQGLAYVIEVKVRGRKQ